MESSKNNIQSRSIAVNKHDVGYKKLIKSGFSNAIFINDNTQLLNLLYRKRVELIISNHRIVHEIMKSHPEYKDTIVKLDIVLGEPIEFYFAINGKTSKNIINKINQGFNKIVASGKYTEIMAPHYKALDSAVLKKE